MSSLVRSHPTSYSFSPDPIRSTVPSYPDSTTSSRALTYPLHCPTFSYPVSFPVFSYPFPTQSPVLTYPVPLLGAYMDVVQGRREKEHKKLQDQYDDALISELRK
eukprot:951462-Rhodomonas_salina.1